MRSQFLWMRNLMMGLAVCALGCGTGEGEDLGDDGAMSAEEFVVRYADAICTAADFGVSCTDTAGCTVPADADECRNAATAIVSNCFSQTGAADQWLDFELAAAQCLAAVESIDTCEQVGLRFSPACTELTEVAETEVRNSCLRMIDLCDSQGYFFPYMFRRL